MTFEDERISQQTLQLLQRQTEGQIHFSDVFPEVAVDGEEAWWRRTDFDAGLTVAVESSGFPENQQVPIGSRRWLANYGLVLTDDLVRSRKERLASIELDVNSHPDLVAEHERAFKKAPLTVANYAPRDEKNTTEDANGSDFYLAVTESGLEAIVTPLDFLDGLEARHRITGLYRIPNLDHPEFSDDEQFRSARVIRTRRHPDHIEPIFQYGSRKEVIVAKQNGEHPTLIPEDSREGRVAFIDRFGNVKIELRDTREFQKLEPGRFATLVVLNEEKEHEIGVQVANDLRSAPLGKLAVYANCSDCEDEGSNVGFVELAVRVNGNPSESEETAAFKLTRTITGLDIATSELKLVA